MKCMRGGRDELLGQKGRTSIRKKGGGAKCQWDGGEMYEKGLGVRCIRKEGDKIYEKVRIRYKDIRKMARGLFT